MNADRAPQLKAIVRRFLLSNYEGLGRMSHAKFILSFGILLTFSMSLMSQNSNESVKPNTIRMVLTIVKKSGAPSPRLLKEDLEISEDNQPRQIIAVEDQTSVPLSLTFLIDMSPSQAGSVPVERAVAHSLVNSALRSGKDMAALYTFTNELLVVQPLTSDLIAVDSAIQRLQYEPLAQRVAPTSSKPKVSPLGTAIWDAVLATVQQQQGPSFAKARRFIILMTDGSDNRSNKKVSDAIDRAIRSNTIIYAVRLVWDRTDYGYGQETLNQISHQTGGRAFSPKNIRELDSALANIQEDVFSQYVITYLSPSKNSSNAFRKIEISVANREKKNRLELVYPQKYYIIRP